MSPGARVRLGLATATLAGAGCLAHPVDPESVPVSRRRGPEAASPLATGDAVTAPGLGEGLPVGLLEARRSWAAVEVALGVGEGALGRQAYHFAVEDGGAGPDGSIRALWRWREQQDGAWSADEETNRRRVGVLLDRGDASRSLPTAAQVAALGRLAGWLAAVYGADPANAWAAPTPWDPEASTSSLWTAPVAHPWRYVVLHHSATASGDAATFDRWHREKGWGGLGYHFVIGNGQGAGDGELEVGYRWRGQLRGAHAKADRFNEYGIGICLVGNFQETDPTPAQLATTRRLVAALRGRYGIGASGVHGHRDVREGGTECPGRRFPMEEFQR
ncbi:MAG: N-acetylmuramoyl-L-alanine amidase [Planctomycetes bacterium]|nr:N-acetylmuramoyl-L-alanine amidase [Planctomycetota bacterium]